jgi:hypothetical protein
MTFTEIAVLEATDTGGGMTTNPIDPYDSWRQLLLEKLGVQVDGPLLNRPDGRRFQIVRYVSADVVHIPENELRPILLGGLGCRRLTIGMGRHDITSFHQSATYVPFTWTESGLEWQRIWAQYFYSFAMLERRGGLSYRERVRLNVIGWHASWWSTCRYATLGKGLHDQIVSLTWPLTHGLKGVGELQRARG